MCLAFQLAADPDPNVKSGSELLDRLLKVKKVFPASYFIIQMTIAGITELERIMYGTPH